jgi:hypothetical protein
MIIPATVVVGVGGQGSTIALRMRERLLAYASERPQPERERAYINEYVRVFAVDTKYEQDIHSRFPANDVWILQPGNIPQLIRNIARPPRVGVSSQLLRDWWPSHLLAPGDFIAGAGAMRAKGRLAYYLQGDGIASRIADTVTGLRDVRTADPGTVGDAQPVYVLIVGSVSGGTGSGILLSLAMHIRQLVSGNVKIIGAIPLASVMEMAPAKMLEQNVWANCSAALRELEWFLTPPDLRSASIEPFFAVAGSTIKADGRGQNSGTPFDLCYLFTRSNRNGRVFGSHADYTQLIADCLALDISSSVSDKNQALLSNLIQQANVAVRPANTKACKPVVFASAGAASIEYPVPDISDFLGLDLLGHVLDAYFLTPADPGQEAANWVVAHNLEERGLSANPVHEALKKPYVNAVTKDRLRIGTAALIPGLDAANKQTVRGVIGTARKNFDDQWLSRLDALVEQNFTPLVDEHRTAIRQKLVEELRRTDGFGFERALRFATSLHAVLKVNEHDVDQELNGDQGRLQALDRLEKRLTDKSKGAYEELEAAWGKGFFLLQGRAKDTKEQFVTTWWKPYINHCENIHVGQAVIRVYRELLTWLEAVVAGLKDIEQTIQDHRGQLVGEAEGKLGRRSMLVLEERALDHPLLVRTLFKDRLAHESEPGSHTADRIANTILHGPDGLTELISGMLEAPVTTNLTLRRTRLRNAVDTVMERARKDAAGVFEDDVSRLTLWDALAQEAIMRRDLPPDQQLQDEFLRAILGSGTAVSDTELVERYIVARVQQCVKSATPFWHLDGTAELEYKDLFPVGNDGLISYSAIPFSDQRDAVRANLGRALADLGTRAGLAHSTGTESPHRFLVSTRQVGAPLFMLNAQEKESLLNNERQWTLSNGHVYADQRYVGTLPGDFELAQPETRFREARALVLAMHFGYMRYAKTASGKPNRALVQINRDRERPRWTRYSNGIAEALATLKADDVRIVQLEDALTDAWNGVAITQRDTELKTAREWVRDELDAVQAPAGINPRREALELMLAAVPARVYKGGRRV